MFGTVPLGVEVRRTIGRLKDDTTGAVTYRIRRGNGKHGSVAGKIYQDKYPYPDVTGLENNAPASYKAMFAAAVHKWRYDLTEAQKKVYNRRAVKGLRMSGYNLFMREAMKGLVEMYVDRGDPATVDFIKTDLTRDGAWHDLDLSSIVPAGAKAVLLRTRLKSANPGDAIRYRENGNVNDINACGCESLRANVLRTRLGLVAVDVNRVIEYNADNIAWTDLDIVVRGWWT